MNFREAKAHLAARCFVVGANASGKSNFLDAFRFLRDLVVPGGGFQAAVRSRGGVSHIRSLSAGKNTNITINISVGEPDNPRPVWNYELVFNQDNNRQPFIKKEGLSKNGEKIFERPDGKEGRSPADFPRQTWLEQEEKISALRFRDFVEFLKSIRYSHIIPQIIRKPERFVPAENDPYGSDFLYVLRASVKKTRDARLKRIGDALRSVVPQFEDIKFEDDRKERPHLKIKYKNWRAQGVWQTEERFSDGSLRLIGFLWALLDAKGPLLLEEPELSLHTAVVRHLAPLISKAQRGSKKGIRQVIVSTHSYELLNEPGIRGDEVLALIPERNGTRVVRGIEDKTVKILLEQGATVAEAVIPKTEPETASQLTFGW